MNEFRSYTIVDVESGDGDSLASEDMGHSRVRFMSQAGMDKKDVEIALLRSQLNEQRRALDDMSADLRQMRLGKRITKARDIPVLELSHLHGLESASRLRLFFEQVESCTIFSDERIEVAKLRVSIEIAMKIQTMLSNQTIRSWEDLKLQLQKEFATELGFDRAWQNIDNMRYDWQDSPQAFVNTFICQYSLLETKFAAEELPNRDSLLKKKLLRGMPSETHEKLTSFLEPAIPLVKFMDRLEAERDIRLYQKDIKVNTVTEKTENAQVLDLRNQVEQLTQKLTQVTQPRSQLWCSKCRTSTHNTQECRSQPRRSLCYDCNRPNCRRGDPRCPGRRV